RLRGLRQSLDTRLRAGSGCLHARRRGTSGGSLPFGGELHIRQAVRQVERKTRGREHMTAAPDADNIVVSNLNIFEHKGSERVGGRDLGLTRRSILKYNLLAGDTTSV